ncbi:MAG: dUTP diphosphatase [Gracilibacteraceae bacterium]|jgi:dUTP pyrophosphatase|nr:dUTP diphosphatase [Gracilibacteraceae bacterium]
MEDIIVKYIRTGSGENLEVKVPKYATEGSAGMDLSACIPEDIVIKPGEIAMVKTGIAIQIPNSNIGGFVFPRSGLSSRHGITLANCVGVIDSDYIGEIICPVINHGSSYYTIKPGDRIAQIVFMPVLKVQLQETDKLETTGRGAGGFGSTGK